MANGQVGGNTDDMNSAAQHFAQKAEECKTALLSVNQAAENLRSVWQGHGSESCQDVMLRFHKAGQALIAELEEIGNNTHMSAQALTQLDSDLQKAWNGFGG
jgi:WXG100 family type VII secretion target